MRYIRFRGKIKDNGEWVKGSYVYAHKWYGSGAAGHFITSIYGDRRVEIDPDTLGQYTGLDDKNGVGIYEGDIIQGFLSYTKEDRAFIKYEEESMGFVPVPAFDEMSGRIFEVQNSKDIEVIGNIYDNPELLEGDKQ